MNRLDLAQECLLAEKRNAIRGQLENDGSEVGEAGEKFGGNLDQVRVDFATMGVEPMAVREFYTGQVYFPNAFQGNPGQHVRYFGAAILMIDP